ncbi:hypothetical protein [Brevibacillus brevis]|uniref:hypothetical protein n=1 Tax=Brevibacillus brevis TaxID=1393 RepID=UPI0007D8B47F|nr:hypothetical protein [Brevibacillus brevis]
MKIKKTDYALIKEAENEGRSVSMSSVIDRNRTELNKELQSYFNQNYKEYKGSYDENEGEDVLYSLNEYISDHKIDMRSLDFPIVEGTDVYLLPITNNLQLKVIVADEYYGGGNYSKYVMIDRFIITDSATTEDVDKLITVLREYSVR